MNVLLSIKPEYAKRIFDGDKKFEYRRVLFKRADVKNIVVYASAPISKVIGEFTIDRVLFDEVSALWETTKEGSGITEELFCKYFANKNKGYAIQIGKTVRYEQPLSLKDKYGLTPPQSFAYIR